MWPNGYARVSKTLHDGSTPSMTAMDFQGPTNKQAILKTGGISIPPLLFLTFCIYIFSKLEFYLKNNNIDYDKAIPTCINHCLRV